MKKNYYYYSDSFNLFKLKKVLLTLCLIVKISLLTNAQIFCPSIPLEETYACKANIIVGNLDTKDKANGQLILDDGIRVIVGTSYTTNGMRLFIEELDVYGNSIRKQSYQLPNNDVSNVQIIFDRQTDEYILFFDVIAFDRDVYFARIDRATLSTLIRYYGPVVKNIPGTFSEEFAVKIENSHPDKYMLVVNQQIPGKKNSYVVMVDKTQSYAYCPSSIEINDGNKDVVSHDIIETGSIIDDLGCANGTSYLLVGTVDNSAFVAGLNCEGSLFTDANIFDVDGNPTTKDPAKRIQYHNGSFYLSGETGTYLSGNFISGKIWMGSFRVNNKFLASTDWLNIYEKNPGKKETLVDMDHYAL